MQTLARYLAFLLLVSVGTARRCHNVTVPVKISARNAVFNLTAPSTNIEATNFVLDLTQQGRNYTDEVLAGYYTISGEYAIAATYCEPDREPSSGVVQLLTHGIGFDRSYWDLPTHGHNYSYVAAAVDDYRFSTLAWNRLGTGMSQHGEAVNEIQAFLEAAALRTLADMLRRGTVPGVRYPHPQVVLVGHSFGSVLSYAVAAADPNAADALVLTGFSTNGTFLPYFADSASFVVAKTVPRLSGYPAGYLASGDLSAVQANFFSPGDFDPAILRVAYERSQPVTVGELLTLGSADPAVNCFGGPVLVVTGERDVPFCGGNCYATSSTGFSSIPAAVKNNFPETSAFEAFIVPGAGHGLNLEYSHPLTFSAINDFLVKNGIGGII